MAFCLQKCKKMSKATFVCRCHKISNEMTLSFLNVTKVYKYILRPLHYLLAISITIKYKIKSKQCISILRS